MNKKAKNISPRVQMLMKMISDQDKITKSQKINEFRDLNENFKEMININVKNMDLEVREKCISLSFDLQEMSSADRLAFIFEDHIFPREEKLQMLDVCIKLMEQIEEYEVCSTLDRMKKYIITNRFGYRTH